MNIVNQTAPQVGGKIYCCYLDPVTGKVCEQQPRFDVRSPDSMYDDYSHACGDHVEDLKSTDQDVVTKL